MPRARWTPTITIFYFEILSSYQIFEMHAPVDERFGKALAVTRCKPMDARSTENADKLAELLLGGIDGRRVAAKARQGDAAATSALKTEMRRLLGGAMNEARQTVDLKATQGDAHAQWCLGLVHNATQDLSSAREQMRLAALQGYPPAQYQYGCMLRDGVGGPKDVVEARRLFGLAAEQQEGRARTAVTVMAGKGEGIPHALIDAKRLHELAVQGDAEAQLNLGAMYHNGDEVSRDLAEARRWYELAAASVGCEVLSMEAQRNLKWLTEDLAEEAEKAAGIATMGFMLAGTSSSAGAESKTARQPEAKQEIISPGGTIMPRSTAAVTLTALAGMVSQQGERDTTHEVAQPCMEPSEVPGNGTASAGALRGTVPTMQSPPALAPATASQYVTATAPAHATTGDVATVMAATVLEQDVTMVAPADALASTAVLHAMAGGRRATRVIASPPAVVVIPNAAVASSTKSRCLPEVDTPMFPMLAGTAASSFLQGRPSRFDALSVPPAHRRSSMSKLAVVASTLPTAPSVPGGTSRRARVAMHGGTGRAHRTRGASGCGNSRLKNPPGISSINCVLLPELTGNSCGCGARGTARTCVQRPSVGAQEAEVQIAGQCCPPQRVQAGPSECRLPEIHSTSPARNGWRLVRHGSNVPPAMLPPLDELKKPELLEMDTVPNEWQSLCARREAVVSELLAQGQQPTSGSSRARLRELIGQLRISSCRLVEALLKWREGFRRNHIAQKAYEEELERRRREHELADRRRGRANSPASVTTSVTGGGSNSAVQAALPQLFTKAGLRIACTHPDDGQRPETQDGTDYLLKMLTDVWRLPLPSCSDPFALQWFKGSEFAAEKTNTKELAQLKASEKALKRAMQSELHGQLDTIMAVEEAVAKHVCSPGESHDRTSSSRQDFESWRMLAELLYHNGASGFLQMKRKQGLSKHLAVLSSTFSLRQPQSKEEERRRRIAAGEPAIHERLYRAHAEAIQRKKDAVQPQKAQNEQNVHRKRTMF